MAYGNGYEQTKEAQSYSASLNMNTPRALPSVQSEIGAADKRLAELHQALSELENRLTCVLAPEPPAVGGANPADNPVMLSGQIAQVGRGIGYATQRVSALLARLEV